MYINIKLCTVKTIIVSEINKLWFLKLNEFTSQFLHRNNRNIYKNIILYNILFLQKVIITSFAYTDAQYQNVNIFDYKLIYII